MKCILESYYVWQHAHTLGGKTEPRKAEGRATHICHLRKWNGRWAEPPMQCKLLLSFLYKLRVHVMQPHYDQPLPETQAPISFSLCTILERYLIVHFGF